MARLKDLPICVGVKDLYSLDPRLITEKPGFNVRVENEELTAHIEQLATSIAEIGVQQPLTVYMDGDNAIITDGHCRLAATMLAISRGADIKSVPVRVEERYSNEADRTLSLLSRNSGKPLTVLEQSSVVKRLLAFGWSESDVRKKTGYSTTHIKNLIELSAAPTVIQYMVGKGQVSATQAVKTVKKDGDKAAEKLQSAVKTAAATGKKKASAKHIEPKSTVTIDWQTFTKKLREAIFKMRDTEGDDFKQAYAEAVALAESME